MPISDSKNNQAVIFDQLIKYNVGNMFFSEIM